MKRSASRLQMPEPQGGDSAKRGKRVCRGVPAEPRAAPNSTGRRHGLIRTAADPRAAGPGLERPGRRARKRGPRLACAVGRSSSPPRSPARRNCRNHCVSETTEKSPLAGNCTEWRGVQARGEVCGSRRATPPVTAASALPPSCRERCLSDRFGCLRGHGVCWPASRPDSARMSERRAAIGEGVCRIRNSCQRGRFAACKGA